jgi:PAS domain-containing protein
MLLPSIHSESPALKPAFRRSVTFVAGFAIAIGAMWLLAWAIGIPQRLVNTSIITMKTNMALALLLSGTSLLLIGVPNSRPWRRLAGGSAGAMVFLIGALTLYEHLFQQSLGIDQLFFTEPPGATSILSPNRMGPPGAISLVLIGSALLTLVGRRRAVTPYLGLLVCLISLVPAVGYLYGARAFYGNAYLTVIAWPTIPALMALGIGLVLACPETGPMPMLLRGDAGGALLRHLLPATLVVPVVLGYVRTRGEMAGLYGASTGRALLILSLIVVFSTLLWVSATRLSMLAAAERAGQESLLRSEERFRAFVNASSDVVYSMNADWSEMRQLDGRGFLSDTPSPSRQWVEEYIEPEDRAQVLSAIQSAIRTKSVYELEHRIRRADGSLGWTLSRAVPMLNDRGEIAEWFGTAINVTVRKQAEM